MALLGLIFISNSLIMDMARETNDQGFCIKAKKNYLDYKEHLHLHGYIEREAGRCESLQDIMQLTEKMKKSSGQDDWNKALKKVQFYINGYFIK